MDERYVYYWYNHLAISFEACAMIDELIEDHDYKAFLCIKEILERNSKLVYFPMIIYDYEKFDEDGTCREIEINEETFNLIEYAENECG